MPLLGKFGTATSRAFGFNGGGIVNVPIPVPPGTVYNYDVYDNRGPAYVPGIANNITVTVPAGTTIGSTSTGTYALLVPSAFNPLDSVTIINDGVIQGMGGAGGAGSSANNPLLFPPATPGLTGGNAIYVNRPTTITNNGVVASGGGGGGGGGGKKGGKYPYGGGGGGGGAGTNGGSGGAAGGGSSPIAAQAGSPGTSPAGGSGGARGAVAGVPSPGAGPGGAGGGRGAAGTAGTSGGPAPATPGAPGGAAGNYIVGNPFVTWPVTGTRQGGVA